MRRSRGLLVALALALAVVALTACDEKPRPKAQLESWERVDVGDDGWTGLYRTRVPGGWLYRERVTHGASLAFVPDPSPEAVSTEGKP